MSGQRIEITPELFREVFEVDKRGAAILDYLVKRFNEPAVLDGGIDAVIKTYHRMGQRRPLDYCMAMINRANGAEPTAAEAAFDNPE